jgi:hypothetical protein
MNSRSNARRTATGVVLILPLLITKRRQYEAKG